MRRSLHYEKTTTVAADVHFEETVVLGRTVRVVSRAAGLEGLNADPESRLRSYEIERGLAQRYGGFWVVGEWCPFNGIYTAWRHFAPPEVLEANAQWWEEHRAKMTAEGFNVDYHIATVRGPQEPARWLEDERACAAGVLP